MDKMIDCLFVGHNFTEVTDRFAWLRKKGFTNTPEYRDLNMNFINYCGKDYSPNDLFNQIYYNEHLNKDNFGLMKMSSIFNGTIAYLANYLAKRGFTIDFVNTFKAQKEELAKKLTENQVRSVAISTTFYVDIYSILEVIQFVKKYNKTARIIVGGTYVLTTIRLTPENELQDYLRNFGADFYIYSTEGESALAGIVNALKNNLGYEQIKNIFYWDGTEFKFTESAFENNSFDDGVLNPALFQNDIGNFAYLKTTRNCPFSCSFCNICEISGPYTTASVEIVEQMLNALSKIDTVSRVMFVDDTFNVPINRFKEILRMMIKNKYKFKWFSFLRCQFVDRETVELMKESGCEFVFLGIESGSQKILDNMNKKVNIEQYHRGISLLNEYGIISIASLIVGYPGETYETFLETKSFIEESKPTFYRPNPWVCEPLSPINKCREKYKIQGLFNEWSHETMDSITARNLIDDMFMTINNSIWIMYQIFESAIFSHLLLRGLSMEEVKKYFSYFSMALKEKIKNPGAKEISPEIIEGLRSALRKDIQKCDEILSEG